MSGSVAWGPWARPRKSAVPGTSGTLGGGAKKKPKGRATFLARSVSCRKVGSASPLSNSLTFGGFAPTALASSSVAIWLTSRAQVRVKGLMGALAIVQPPGVWACRMPPNACHSKGIPRHPCDCSSSIGTLQSGEGTMSVAPIFAVGLGCCVCLGWRGLPPLDLFSAPRVLRLLSWACAALDHAHTDDRGQERAEVVSC